MGIEEGEEGRAETSVRLYASLEGIHISLGEIHKWEREIYIPSSDLHIFLEEKYISKREIHKS